MNRPNVRHDVLGLLNRLHKEYPNKSPYIFGPGFDKSGFKTFDADRELVIPDAICVNSHVLDLLSDSKTVFHIDKYMESSGRSPTVSQNVGRTAVLVIMMSCVKYSFNMETFPYCSNQTINQMWADMEQMAKGDHVCCTIIAMAMRGRSHTGFTREHAARSQVPPVSVLDIPKFERPVTLVRPKYFPPPPPPPPQTGSEASPSAINEGPPESKDLPKSFAKLFNKE